MIYRAIKGVVRIALAVFFKRIAVSGAGNIPGHGPLIVVANHPNTLMDPLIVAALMPQRIGFVANAGLFANKVLVAFFRFFHVIPIFRRKDVAPGEKPDNTQAFAQCHAYLDAGGTFLIFPEGSSYYEIRLREIKTGTARIALSYEQARGFAGGTRILPVALDYSDAIQFRSLVAVTVGEPIDVAAYRSIHAHDEPAAVAALTEAIRAALARHVPSTSGKDDEDLLIKAHAFHTTYAAPEADLHRDPAGSLAVRKQVADALGALREQRPALFTDTAERLDAYFDALHAEGITRGFLTDRFLRRDRKLLLAAYLLEALLLLPIHLFGLLTNYLPYILPSQVYRMSGLEVEYKAPVQLVTGLLTFPTFYALELWALVHFTGAGMTWRLLFLAMLPLSGYITLHYWNDLQRLARLLRFSFRVRPERIEQLVARRDAILERMEQARRCLTGAA
ncbi:MAG: 1-acyl-sn-glycerol-3-phosphate acyltransferase [Flavobacteriales bacterium]|nr:1-acyl-sn-glycerol-3-phosphate acyltransferase [Flavobacteriales bacterium]